MKDNSKLLTNQTKGSWKIWIAALRLKSISASFAPVIVGASLSLTTQSSIDWLIPLIAVVSSFLIQMGTNLINDAFDHKRGADDKHRLGPIRLVQSSYLSAKQVYYAGICSFLLALFFGIPLILKGGIPLLFVLLLSCACGYFYTAGPKSLAYTGLGDIFVLIFFGIVLTSAVYFLETSQITMDPIVAGIQMGLLAVNLIAVNNLRDCEGDARANKRTLAVRFGKTFARCEITFCVVAPFALGLLYWVSRGFLIAAFLPLAALPIAVTLIQGIWIHPPGFIYNKFFGIAGMLQLLFAILLSLGFCTSRFLF